MQIRKRNQSQAADQVVECASGAGKAWHQMPATEVLRRLGVDRTEGLSDAEIQTRHAQFGPNELIDRGAKSGWKILAEQLTGIFVVILILAGIASVITGDRADAAAIFAIVLLNTVLGFVQEFRAEKAIIALKKMSVPLTTVRRSGTVRVVKTSQLVPGDILLLESGNMIPADCRVLETRNLRVQESVLTGESEPIEKRVEPVQRGDVALGDRRDMVFMGTFVTYGRAEAVVTDTGMRTELGRVAEMLHTVERQPTPLQQRLRRVARDLAFAATSLVIVVFVLGLIHGEDLKLLFLTSVSLLVAAVPEGLPAVVTIALALGTQRLLRRHALVRKLNAVETLGSVTVICSDKTGTLTENRMTLVLIDVAGHRLQVAEHARARELLMDCGDAQACKLRDPEQLLTIIGAALCNDAVLRDTVSSGEFHAIGDPTEAAFVVAAAHFQLPKAELERVFPRIHEAPFESNRKRMTTVHRIHRDLLPTIEERYPMIRFALSSIGISHSTKPAAPHLGCTKGAVEALLDTCSEVLVDGHREQFTTAWQQRVRTANEELAGRGMRVLGVAMRSVAENELSSEAQILESDLTFVGLLALADPPRAGVKNAIERCTAAGVRTVMITGDHPATAQQVAEELGIARNSRILTGEEVAQLSVEGLTQLVEDVHVYARVSPEHKLKIVEALQRRDEVVAMTGDGVNDAPALRKASVGVTMGVVGTDVAKEAADMVLLDDNFSTIVAAVEEGRVIYDNLRKFITYALSSNAGEILVMLLAPLAGMPLALLPLQILWINLVTDGLPGLALAVEPAERDVMNRRPYNIHKSLFAEGVAWRILGVGLLVGFLSFGMGYWYWKSGAATWQTVVFTTLTLSQMGNVLAIRSSKESLFRIGILSNKPLLFVVALTVLLQLVLIYVPLFQNIFRTTPLSAVDLVVAVVFSTVVFWAVEADKYFSRGRGTVSGDAG